jgi:glutathione S-transferase
MLWFGCLLVLPVQVWLALEEKQIPYDCVLIELYNKPEWYKQLVPTSLVPAVVSGTAAVPCSFTQQQPQQQHSHTHCSGTSSWCQ